MPVSLPTKAHIRSMGVERIAKSWPKWEPLGIRKPWRLLVGDDFLRKPNREVTQGYPKGLPGLPYEFNTAAEAMAFRDGCMTKIGLLDLSKARD